MVPTFIIWPLNKPPAPLTDTAMTSDITTARSDEILERLTGLHPKLIDLSLDRLKVLLAKMGNPQDHIPPVIHVAGTNGKGSTTAFMRAIFEAAGLRVHVYTSPHLVRFHERIRLAGQLIDDDELCRTLEDVETANKGEPITFFEVTTAAAFLAFSRHEADVVLLEVGLGGRFDATNVIDSPLVSVITPIHMDHQAFLGNSFQKIAREKAGIIKANCPVIIAPQLASVSRVLNTVAETLHAPVIEHNKQWHIRNNRQKPGTFKFQDIHGSVDLPTPRLPGAHQIRNAAVTVAAVRSQQRFNIPESAIRAGLDWAQWPARLQNLNDTDLNQNLPEGTEIWLDGGHNPIAARVIREHFKSTDTITTPFYMICGMLKNKDSMGFFMPFRGFAECVIAVDIPGDHDAMSAAELAAEASNVGIQGRMAASVRSAVQMIAKEAHADTPPKILICGSLYLAGEVLKETGAYPT